MRVFYVPGLRLGNNNWSLFWEIVAKITINWQSLIGPIYCIVSQEEKQSLMTQACKDSTVFPPNLHLPSYFLMINLSHVFSIY